MVNVDIGVEGCSVVMGWRVRMCRVEELEWEMGAKSRVEKLKNVMVCRSRMKVWMMRGMTSVLVWTCVVQLMALEETWGPRLLKGWPSCFSHSDLSSSLQLSPAPPKLVLPPKSRFWVQFFLCGSLKTLDCHLVGIDLLWYSSKLCSCPPSLLDSTGELWFFFFFFPPLLHKKRILHSSASMWFYLSCCLRSFFIDFRCLMLLILWWDWFMCLYYFIDREIPILSVNPDCGKCCLQGFIRIMAILWFLAMEVWTKCEQQWVSTIYICYNCHNYRQCFCLWILSYCLLLCHLPLCLAHLCVYFADLWYGCYCQIFECHSNCSRVG